MLAEAEPAGPGRGLRREKASEMALPTLLGSDGRRAVLAFSCLPALAGWRPDARPVPVTGRQVWQAGAEEASAVVIDVAGPVPFAVDGARLAALAAGPPPPLPHDDPDVQARAAAALAGEPPVAGFALLPGGGGGDLTIQVTLAPGYGPSDARAQAAIQRAVERLVAGGGGRVRRGITVAVSTGGQPAGTPPAGGPGGRPPGPGAVGRLRSSIAPPWEDRHHAALADRGGVARARAGGDLRGAAGRDRGHHRRHRGRAGPPPGRLRPRRSDEVRAGRGGDHRRGAGGQSPRGGGGQPVSPRSGDGAG